VLELTIRKEHTSPKRTPDCERWSNHWVFDPAVQTVRATTAAQRREEIDEKGQAVTCHHPA